MKKSIARKAMLCGAAAPAFIFAAQSQASLLIADGFDYPAGTLSGKTETAANQTWQLTGATDGSVVAAGSLTYGGTNPPPALPGDSNSDAYNDSVKLNNSSTTNADRISLSQSIGSGTLYYSLELKVTGLGTDAGSFIAGFNNLTGTQAGALTVGGTALYLKQDGTTGKYQVGVSQKASSATTVYNTTTDFAAGTNGDTLFIVGSYTFSSTGDSSNLYVFTSADTVPATDPPATPFATSQGTTSTFLATSDVIQSFFLRNQASAPATTVIDDVRVGTTYADVVSGTVVSAPEPASLGIIGGALALMTRRRKDRSSAT